MNFLLWSGNKMKKLCITAFLLALGMGAAFAADLAPRIYSKAPALADPTYDWSGFYVGVNAGGAWGAFRSRTTTDFNPAPLGGPLVYIISNQQDVPALASVGAQDLKGSSFTGGGQAGYNWQRDRIVLGIEADMSYVHLRGADSRTIPYPILGGLFSMTVASQAAADWLFTLRPRVGFAYNNWLFYGTGGLALTELRGNFRFTDDLGPALETGSISQVKTGWTIGGGMEVGLGRGWTVKAEYLYVDFGSVSTISNNLVTLAPPEAFPANIFHHSTDLKANIARLGLNYRL
jgi:outer membrane immunogenic protein